jgi:hypothetical protein
VDPRTGWSSDRFLDDVNKSREVVIGDPLALTDGNDERVVDYGRSCSAGDGVFGGDDPELRLCFDGEQLDLEVPAESRGVGPHLGHLRERVALDHCQIK